jgi:hypothetical protein
MRQLAAAPGFPRPIPDGRGAPTRVRGRHDEQLQHAMIAAGVGAKFNSDEFWRWSPVISESSAFDEYGGMRPSCAALGKPKVELHTGRRYESARGKSFQQRRPVFPVN